MTIPSPSHNLPAQTTPFVGRTVELAEVTRLLIDSEVRLLTIVGHGGMGKTRLARQSGRQVLDHFPGHFPDGVWYLSLAAVDSDTFGPDLDPLLNCLAGVLGVTLRSAENAEEEILEHLRDRQLLLILDNLEHLVESSAVISALLRGADGVTVLVTSRERLNLQEEWLFSLAGLAVPLEEQRVGESVPPPTTEAMLLFTQAAQRVQPAFDPDPDERVIAHICRLVEGMPLGIELAAGWVRYMAPSAIVQEIQDSIDFLTSNVRNLPARHRSLRAVFDHSWALLSPEEQAVLPQLAVFRGGFRLAEAQAVTGATRLVLTGFVDKSLVSVSAEGRYDLHERLRQYLLEKLREDRSVYQAAHDRHSQVYLAMLQLDPTELSRQKVMQSLAADFDNIRAAWHWAIDHAHWSAIRRTRRGLHVLCLNKSRYLEENAFFERTISRLEHQLTQRDPSTGETETEMQLLLAALRCDLYDVQARLVLHDPTRQARLDENLNILRTIGTSAYPELADVLSRHASRNRRRRVDYDIQRRYGEEALPLCQSLGDRYGQVLALQGLGIAALFSGQFATATSYAEQLSALAELEDDPYSGFQMQELRGDIAVALGDYPEAEGHYRQAYHLAINIDPTLPAAPFLLANLANVTRLQGDFAQATAYLRQTTESASRDGFRPHRHHKILLISGYLAEAQGAPSAAQWAFAEIWQQDRGQSYFSPAALIGLGRVALHGEDWSAACDHFATALPLIEQLETAPQALDALAGVAHWRDRLGQLEQALSLIGLVQHHPGSYQESKDRLAGLLAELQAALPPEQVQVALAQGQAGELWDTVGAVQAEIGSLASNSL